ncbi:hypothetical protein SERLADRAFT_417509 [Serpula lacrymans var. lacrymans S7.9]|uniref:Cytosine-specific methyltransferase n=1 Tax=Serpula lacrymans var. lacrymans (strain S7.9) TaxID=578457 RepID=F8P6P9_SERL9|nr:uncharacterized protein SERLADRAFT_417509 [Serpula lacrymans var. lacrymans S7.9]EGO21115.1 hypothetical protein SERLADRAFT_417509 [Serpula lacrymans var. lacrymans S7.9]
MSPRKNTRSKGPQYKRQAPGSASPSGAEDSQSDSFPTRKRKKSHHRQPDSDSETEPGDTVPLKARVDRRVPSLSASEQGDALDVQQSGTSNIDDHTIPQEPIFYDADDDELLEDHNLQIIGETDPIEYQDSNDAESVPVRVLSDFTIYNKNTMQLVPIAELLHVNLTETTSYGASGVVKPWIDDEELDDDDDADEEELAEGDSISDENQTQRVRLTMIRKFTLHDMKKTGRGLDRLKCEDFVETLKITPTTPDDIAISIKILGRELRESDLLSDDVTSYLRATLEELREDEKINLFRVPIMRTLFGQEFLYNEEIGTKRPPLKRTSTSRFNIEMDVLKHRNQTVVTPVVASISQQLFERVLKIAGKSLAEDHMEEDEPSPAHHAPFIHAANPSSIQWLEQANHPGYFTSVLIDGRQYSVGDTIMVVPGIDENAIRAQNDSRDHTQSRNSLGNTQWFCVIQYLFETSDGHKRFHAQWLAHSSKTLLQETGHPHALFLMTTDCEDIDLEAISQKCNIRQLSVEQDEPPENSFTQENDFFSGLAWNTHDHSLIDLHPEDVARALAHCTEGEPCFSCGLRNSREAEASPSPLPGCGFTHYSVKYHVHDFVYIKSCSPNILEYDIGQIVKVKAMERPPTITVRLYGRYDDIVRRVRGKRDKFQVLGSDDRRLFKTSKFKAVTTDTIDGMCYVMHSSRDDTIDDWCKHDNHFYVHQYANSLKTDSLEELEELEEKNFTYCKQCYEDRKQTLRHTEELLQKNEPLRGLELFSGAGGLGTGLDMSGFVETRWAVEFSPSAAMTYQANHSHTTVYNQCTNVLLQHAIDTHEGKNPKPLKGIHSGKVLPGMPKPGDVDFIYGGPPCQSFSGINHWKKANDIRSTLICNMLSYVEFYRPSYFLLENVTGILNYRLKGRMEGRSTVDGIEMGVVKFILRSLAALGYQIRFNVLQAGQYGAPQGRQRVIFWGAKRGLLLPELPIPTHGFVSRNYKVSTGTRLPRMTRSKDPTDDHLCSPFRAVTINDAIGDLPGFDWINPHLVYPSTSRDKTEKRTRETEHGILAFDAGYEDRRSQKYPGYSKPMSYAHQPMTRYQKWIRGSQKKVKYQYTRRFGDGIIERVINVPLKPNADYHSLPKKLHMKMFDKKGAKERFRGLYGRLDGESQFKTALTTVAPNAKGGNLLHPSQKRIVTVRECARAQGFPDSYEFLSVNTGPEKIVADTPTNRKRCASAIGTCTRKVPGSGTHQDLGRKGKKGKPRGVGQ